MLFVVSTDTILDSYGDFIASGEVVKVFDSIEKANYFIKNVKETYYTKKSDYTITEMEVE